MDSHKESDITRCAYCGLILRWKKCVPHQRARAEIVNGELICLPCYRAIEKEGKQL